MALIMNKELKGLNKEWYCKITSFKGVNKGSTQIRLDFFVSREHSKTIDNSVGFEMYSFESVAGRDIIEQGYEYLKGLPGFENAVDVFEEGQPSL